MAKKLKPEDVEVGTVFRFKGYAEAQKEPMFAEGDYLRVIELMTPEEGEEPYYRVARFMPKDKPKDPGHDLAAYKKNPKAVSEMVYLDEVTAATEEDAEEDYLENADGKKNVQTPYNGKSEKISKTALGGKAKRGDTPTETKADTHTESKDTMKSKALKTKKGAAKKAAAPAKKAPVLAKAPKAKKEPKVKKAAALVKAEVLPPIKDSATVVDVLKRHKNDALGAVQELENLTQMSRWTLGGVLSKIHREKTFVKVGKKKYTDDLAGWTAFCDEQTNTGYRVAMILIQNYEHFSRIGVDEKVAAAIPYHKLKEVVSVATDLKSAEKWMDKAADMTREALKTEVKTFRLESGTEGPKTRHIRGTGDEMARVTLRLFNDQKTKLLKALEKAKKKIPSKDGEEVSDGQALDLIISEWLSEQ